MFLRVSISAILACLSLVAFADSPSDTITIPLKDIWALDMPGTKDVNELSSRDVPVLKIEEKLHLDIPGEPPQFKIGPAKEGFAVAGIGKDALKQVFNVFVEKQLPQKTFAPTDDISIVFFSRQAGTYVHLKSIERYGDVINIQYIFVPHETKEMTDHFALIPLGHLEAGKYQVRITQLPFEQKYLDQGFKDIDKTTTEKVVCQPFDFSVKGQSGN